MSSLPKELEFEKLNDEKKYHRAVPGYMRRLRDLYEAIYERYGDDGLELIRKVSRDFGTAVGTNVKKKGSLKGLHQVAKYLLKVFDMVSDDWEVAELSKDRVVITVSRCPYPFTKDEVCRAHTCMEQALVATLDDSLDYRIGRSIPQGDSCCEHILCVRGDTTTNAEPSNPDTD
jgi:hypothetical protein